MSKKIVLTAGFTLAVAVLAVAAGSFIAPRDSTASAQSAAKQSSEAVAKLSPAAKQDLAQHTAANLDQLLKQVGDAKDAEMLTYDQVKASYPGSIPSVQAGDTMPDVRALKYLKFTDKNGAITIIGVDSQHLPVVIAQPDSN